MKLRHLDSWNAARGQLAARYQAMLGDTPLILPCEAEDRRHVWHLYVVRHAERDGLRRALMDAGIGTGLHYPIPVHLQPAYAHVGHRVGDFPVAEQVAQECLSLPMYAELREEEQDHIVQTLKQTIGAHRVNL